MRISDWSSDVCSSDLDQATTIENQLGTSRDAVGDRLFHDSLGIRRNDRAKVGLRVVIRPDVERLDFRDDERAQLLDRKIVVEGKSVSVRVDLGGRRIIKKKRKLIGDSNYRHRI